MTLDDSVVTTLSYSDHFGFPLTLDELHTRLIQNHASKLKLKKALSRLASSGLIGSDQAYYFLPGHAHLIARRLSRSKSSEALLTRAKYLVKKLSHLPGILAIFLTGSLAMKNSVSSDDIDLMIITRPGKLWTTRLIITLYTTVLGLRRSPYSTSVAGKLCLNLYLTPKSFSLPISKRSLYTAYELIQAKPLFDPHNMRGGLLAANPWIFDYLCNYPLPPRLSTPISNIQYPIYEKIFEILAYKLQLAYMKPKITREFITPDSAFFHPHTPGKKILSLSS